MAVLKAKARAKSAVVKVKGAPPSGQKFPVPDKAHAKAALARINQARPPLTSSQKAAVRSKAKAVLGKKADVPTPGDMTDVMKAAHKVGPMLPFGGKPAPLFTKRKAGK